MNKFYGFAGLALVATVVACSSGGGDDTNAGNQDLSGAGAPSATPATSGTAPAAVAPAGATTIKPSTNPDHELVGSVVGVRGIATDDSSPLSLRVLEMASGDPAMNGDRLVLVAGSNEDAPTQVFELGLDINELTTAELSAANTVHLVGKQDTMNDATGEIQSGQPFDATITLTPDGSGVKNVVSIATGGKSTSVTAGTDAGLTFLADIFKVTGAQVGGIEARVVEVGAGDPAMNGDTILLVLNGDHGQPVFDLGLNIAGIDALTASADTQLKIDGEENFDPSNIQTRKVSYSVTFTPDNDNEVTSIAFKKL